MIGPTLAERVALRMRERSLTVTDLARAAGVGRANVNKLLTSKTGRTTSLDVLQRIAIVLRANPSYLVAETDSLAAFTIDRRSSVASRIEARRSERGLSYKALGDRSGVHRTGIAKIVRYPERSPLVETVRRIAAGLGTTFADLSGEIRTPRPERRPPVRPPVPAHLVDVADSLGLPFSELLALAVYADALDTHSGRLNLTRAPRAWQALWRRTYGVPTIAAADSNLER